MHKRGKLGAWGESVAAKYLVSKGYKIIAQNYRCPLGEIDLVAMLKGELAFIEVKTRRTLTFGRPAEAVTKNKQEKIKSIALYFLHHELATYSTLSFDVIEVYPLAKEVRVNHIPRCF